MFTTKNGEINKKNIPNDSINLNVSSFGYQKLKIPGLNLKNITKNNIELKLSLDQNMMILGMIISCPPIINKDPETHGQTIITGKEIRRTP